MRWIGLTGGIASGKTTVANRLRSMGFSVVDADDLARRAVEPGTPGLASIVQAFGREILAVGGELDRSKLGAKIFANPDLRLKLEAIVHPEVRRLSLLEKKALETGGSAIAFYDVPLLFEKQMENMFDAVVLVFSLENMQRDRLAKRNGYSKGEIDSRLASQMPLKTKKAKAQFVIDNTGSLDDLYRSVDEVLAKLNVTMPKNNQSPPRR